MEGGGEYEPAAPDDVFRDYMGRRNAFIKALTTDADKFYRLCDPDKENLCLFGFANGTWEVNLPGEEVPPEIPEPVLGINFARDGMDKKDWITLVAIHSDSWLLSLAFYFAARFGFEKEDRNKLFNMINSHPTILDVLRARSKNLKKEKTSNTKSNKSSLKRSRQLEVKTSRLANQNLELNTVEDNEEDYDEHGTTLCGVCGKNDAEDEFWICCDVCEQWFHGECVRVTPARAKLIKQYKCPTCSNNRSRV